MNASTLKRSVYYISTYPFPKVTIIGDVGEILFLAFCKRLMHDFVFHPGSKQCKAISMGPQLARVTESHNGQEPEDKDIHENPPDKDATDKSVAGCGNLLSAHLKEERLISAFVDDRLNLSF